MQQRPSSVTLAHSLKLGNQLLLDGGMELRQHDRNGIALEVHERIITQHPHHTGVDLTHDPNLAIVEIA